ncbi:hypothetical protein HDU87_005864 [Geranomyces variabilis]|uniref:Amylo-alpha-1,6-glucosidase n=1 Tax=Geranomyces variabilis TaxID=109894 RepID=A0AAD5TPZ7_9FUNG|nr:hypothetical protein HDU87_005864 [Geranomyces variabilis]
MGAIFILRLGDTGLAEGRTRYVRLPPPLRDASYTLRFVLIAGSLASKDPVLYTNYPQNGSPFQRTAFNPVPFSHSKLSDPAAEVLVSLPGVFEYFVEYRKWNSDTRVRTQLSGTFTVDPRLYLPTQQAGGVALLPLNGISILTVIPKWMPTISAWPEHFAAFSKVGYNMVHLAPLNARGMSNSPYSIFDQLSLSDDLFDFPLSEDEKERSLNQSLKQIRTHSGVLAATDIVWNHTACNSTWLRQHPEAGYNLNTAPHLRSACEIEDALLAFSDTWNAVIETEEHLEQALSVVKTSVLPSVKLWEFYVIDLLPLLQAMRPLLGSNDGAADDELCGDLEGLTLKEQADVLREIALINRQDGHRHAKTLDVEAAYRFMKKLSRDSKVDDIDQKLLRYEQILNELNLVYYEEHDADLAALIDNLSSRAKFLRLAPNGPRLGKLTRREPLVDIYFTRISEGEAGGGRHPDELVLANNGWIWNADPLINFAAPGSKAYLRREVIAWSDCVKLRYGEKPEDSPWLWSHQIAYTQKMARLFDGLRIDNCHSTPIHVASALLDSAREVNPDLYVFAELFTGSEDQDILFVSKLGINSLIREAMNAGDAKELSRLVHRHGGQPVGSITLPVETFPLEYIHNNQVIPTSNGHQSSDVLVQLSGSSPHALFMDCTHDNEMPNQKRTAVDTLANSAIVAMSDCAVGSVLGYDDIFPALLDLVREKRKYRSPNAEDGIKPAKAVLYKVHADMAREGFSEIHVHQEGDFISIHRMHPISHEGFLLVARCSFREPSSAKVHSTITLQSQSVELVASATLSVEGTLVDEPGVIGGLPSKLSLSKSDALLTRATVQSDSERGFRTTIEIDATAFIPGSIVLYRTAPITPKDPKREGDAAVAVRKDQETVYQQLRGSLALIENAGGISLMVNLGRDPLVTGYLWHDHAPDSWPRDLLKAVSNLGATDVNVALYRCASEEEDALGESVYDVPNFGKLAYCGLQGFVSALQLPARTNDLGHPLFANLRAGPWIPNYILGRLQRHLITYPALASLHSWLAERLRLLTTIAPAFMPKYFVFVIFSVHQALCHRALTMHPKCVEAPTVASSLGALSNACSMMSFQLYGRVNSAGLLPSSYPLPPLISATDRLPALAAGLPHFATQYMRCWGRDIFISLPGSFIQSGNYAAARAHLIAFGSTMRHGLIPNLLDQGIGPRFNARDAAWWWAYAVQKYCRESPEGYSFLGVEVARRFTPLKRYRNPGYLEVTVEDDDGRGDTYCKWDDPSTAFRYRNTIAQLCHELFERHAHGIQFREYNAGPNLDHAMRSEGFDVTAGVDWQKGGLPVGGNRWNCGTWMDKMGDSEKAQTKGLPATPRDGAAIEVVGLAKSSLGWIAEDVLGKGLGAKWWKWDAVTALDGDSAKSVTYADWNSSLKQSFEKWFFISSGNHADQLNSGFHDLTLVNRREIYKDTVGASLKFMDYQLRPNLCIAMVVAPELFDPDHARRALSIVRDVLVGPLGIKTLDPADWAYRGTYDNSNDGSDPTVAHGYNYHQGPEWVYPLAFFLRAYLHFFTKAVGHDSSKISDVYLYIQRALLKHKEHILSGNESPYAGLPELTNESGTFSNQAKPVAAGETRAVQKDLAAASVGKQEQSTASSGGLTRQADSIVDKRTESSAVLTNKEHSASVLSAGPTTTTAVIVAQVSIPITADGTSKQISEDLSKQIAHQVTHPGEERERTGAEGYATVNLEKSINNAINQQLSASESQLAKPAGEKKTVKEQLTSSIGKLAGKSNSNLNSRNALAHEAPVAMAEAISTAVAKELSTHAGDSMGMNQVANSIDAAVAKSRGNLQQEEVNVKSIEVTTEIEHDAAGTPIAIHTAVIAISEVPVDKAYDDVKEPLKQKSKSTASIAVAHVPISKGPSQLALGHAQSKRSLKDDHLSSSARQSLTQLTAELAQIQKAERLKSSSSMQASEPHKSARALTNKSSHSLEKHNERVQSKRSLKGDHLSTSARQSLTQLTTELAEMQKADERKSSSSIKDLGAHKSAQALNSKSTPALDNSDVPASHSAVASGITKSGSRISLSGDAADKKRVTVRVKNSASRQSLAEGKKDEAKSQPNLKDKISPETRESLERLNQQLATERGLPLEKAASVLLDGNAIKQSLKNLAHRDSPDDHEKPSQPEPDVTARKSLANLERKLERERASVGAGVPAVSGNETNAVAVAIAPVELHADAAPQSENAALNAGGESESVRLIKQETLNQDHHRSAKDVAIGIKNSLQSLARSKEVLADRDNKEIKISSQEVKHKPEAVHHEDHSHMTEQAALESHAKAERLSQEILAEQQSNAIRNDQQAELSNVDVTEKSTSHRSASELAHDIKHSIRDLSHRGSSNKLASDTVVLDPAKPPAEQHRIGAGDAEEKKADLGSSGKIDGLGSHRSLKERAAEAKQSLQNLTHKISKAETEKGEREPDQRFKSLKDLTTEAKASIKNLSGAGNNEQHSRATDKQLDSSAETPREAAALEPPSETTVPVATPHDATTASKEGLADSSARVEDTNAEKAPVGAANFAADVKTSIQNLTSSHATKTTSKPELSAADRKEVKSTSALNKREEGVVATDATGNAAKGSSLSSLKEAASHAKQSVRDLLHLGHKQESPPEADITDGATAAVEGNNAADALPSARLAPDAALEMSVDIDVSKHDSATEQGDNNQSVRVTASVDIVPAQAAANLEARHSAEKLAKDVGQEAHVSAGELREQVSHVREAESHVSTASLTKVPATKSTKSLAKEEVGQATKKAEEHIKEGDESHAAKRPPSGPGKKSRPVSGSKGALRPISPPTATSRKASATDLHKTTGSGSISGGKSAGQLSQAADRRRSLEAANKAAASKASVNNLADQRATSTVVARGSINALHQSLQNDQGSASRSAVNRGATSPKGSKQNLGSSANVTKATATRASNNAIAKSPKASAQNIASTTPRTSHPILAQAKNGSVEALAQPHGALAQSNRSIAEAKTGASASNAALSKAYTTTASTPAVNQPGRLSSQSNLVGGPSNNALQKEPSAANLRTGSKVASRVASADKLNELAA